MYSEPSCLEKGCCSYVYLKGLPLVTHYQVYLLLYSYMYVRLAYKCTKKYTKMFWQNTHNIHLIVYILYMYTYTMCASTNGSSPPCNLVSRGGYKGESFSSMTLYLCQSQCAHNTSQLLLWVVWRTLQTTARCLYLMRVVG